MNKQEIFEMIVRIICEILPELRSHHFKPEDQLVDLGANSVDRAEIIAEVLEELSLNIPRLELFGVKNIGGLAEVLYDKSQSA